MPTSGYSDRVPVPDTAVNAKENGFSPYDCPEQRDVPQLLKR